LQKQAEKTELTFGKSGLGTKKPPGEAQELSGATKVQTVRNGGLDKDLREIGRSKQMARVEIHCSNRRLADAKAILLKYQAGMYGIQDQVSEISGCQVWSSAGFIYEITRVQVQRF